MLDDLLPGGMIRREWRGENLFVGKSPREFPQIFSAMAFPRESQVGLSLFPKMMGPSFPRDKKRRSDEEGPGEKIRESHPVEKKKIKIVNPDLPVWNSGDMRGAVRVQFSVNEPDSGETLPLRILR